MAKRQLAEKMAIAAHDLQEFCERVINDPVYRNRIQLAAQTGTLPHSIERAIWAYAAGNPIEKILITDNPSDLEGLSKDQLLERLELLRSRLKTTDPKESVH